jgi:hypothetical protein
VKRCGDLLRELCLDGKNIVQVPVKVPCPEMRIVRPGDELTGDPDAIARALHAPFENVGHPQFPSDFRNWLGGVAVLHDRGPGNDPKIGKARQIGQNILMHAIAEIGITGLSAHVAKRQNGDRFFERSEVRGSVFALRGSFDRGGSLISLDFSGGFGANVKVERK